MADTSGKWERLFEEIGKINTLLAVVIERQDKCDGQIEKNTRTLRGFNGDVGLVADVGNMKDTIGGIKKIGWIIVSAIVGGFITMGFALFEAVKH